MKFFGKKNKPINVTEKNPQDSIDEKFFKELKENLDATTKDGKSCVVFMSKLYSIDGEDRLNHRMVVAKGFKNDDLPICLNAYKQFTTDLLESAKKRASDALEKVNQVEAPK